jgi:hypothetical protein
MSTKMPDAARLDAFGGRRASSLASAAGGGLVGGMRSRRWGRTVASACLVFGSVAVFVSIYAHASRRVPVLVVVQPVHAGATIQPLDLGTYELSDAGGLPVIPAGSEGAVVGATATVSIEPGTLLIGADYSRRQPLPAGSAIVGAALKVGQFPASGVVPGQHVMVVGTGASCSSPPQGNLQVGTGGSAVAGAGSTADPVPGLQPSAGPPVGSPSASGAPGSSVLVPDAEVYAAAPPPQNDNVGASSLVSLVVPVGAASPVAVCAAAGDVSVVVLPQGGAS